MFFLLGDNPYRKVKDNCMSGIPGEDRQWKKIAGSGSRGFNRETAGFLTGKQQGF